MDKRIEANRNTRLRIIRATVRLLGEKKLSDVSATDIVEEAGVARASYYRNFDSKEDVLLDAGRMIIDDFKKNMQGIEGVLQLRWRCEDISLLSFVSRTVSIVSSYGVCGHL